MRTCFAIIRVHRLLTRDALITLIRALVTSKVDYCNSVLAGISGMFISRLQSVLNAATRLIFVARKSDRITPLLEELHWLKVSERFLFRLCVLAYRCLHGTAPAYLADSLRLATMVEGRRCLRSADTMELLVPANRFKTLGVPFMWRLLVPGTLYHRLLDWRHHFMCFADVLQLNCFAIHTLRDTSIVFVFSILYFSILCSLLHYL